MPDVIVTLPQSFGLKHWLAEGDPAGSEPTGTLYGFTVASKPRIEPGERVYVCYRGVLIGYAPLVELRQVGPFRWSLVRGGGAVAVTIEEPIPGFRGFRYRWWRREVERPFPAWHGLDEAAFLPWREVDRSQGSLFGEGCPR